MSKEYDLYLMKHMNSVNIAFKWLKKYLPELVADVTHISSHDISKYSIEEYNAYDDYFYGEEHTEEVEKAFNLAWLHHIHNNPHHWQHWVLINDDPDLGIMALDMPYDYIIEMIADWWSFSFKTGNLYSMFDWFDEHVNYMILSDKTQKIVIDILVAIKRKLEELGYEPKKLGENDILQTQEQD